MKKNPMTIMTVSAIGALTGMMLMPALRSKTKRKVSRSARNAYFRVSDFIQDIREMRSR
ncbi:MAG: hypothetical protein ACOZCL_02645 [Bacillota bacterium]